MSITPLVQTREDPIPGMREIAEHVKSTLGFDYVTLGVRTCQNASCLPMIPSWVVESELLFGITVSRAFHPYHPCWWTTHSSHTTWPVAPSSGMTHTTVVPWDRWRTLPLAEQTGDVCAYGFKTEPAFCSFFEVFYNSGVGWCENVHGTLLQMLLHIFIQT